YIDSIEAEERRRGRPHLTERAPNVEIDDVRHLVEKDGDDHCQCLRRRGLKIFSLDLLPVDPSSYPSLAKLDVSNNELSDLPGLASLPNLVELCIQRNWFDRLPSEIATLSKLKRLDASRNFLKPNSESLLWDDLKRLPDLATLDLSYNKKCCRVDHRSMIRKQFLPRKVEVVVTVWEEMSLQNNAEEASSCAKKSLTECNTAYVGSSAAKRDPNFLRSQLEPWGTVNLRRRLVQDFGQEPTDPALVNRAGVVERLLRCYQSEGLLDTCGADLNEGVGKRRVIRLDGVPVREELLDEILAELRLWRYNGKRGGSSNNRERPSIQAKCYMIMRAPGTLNQENSALSRRAQRMNKKMEHNRRLWELALEAIKESDPEFASRCSEIAVTYGFTGSPHIDKQNSSPFYGLALGTFTEGSGCVSVECSARVVAEVNTKNRLGKVDGRWPHWVTTYDTRDERFSLIYYDTNSAYQTPGPAIFRMPEN
ncbi:hypothetical protein ACHAWF_017553, partial [Thalassiosira exigua]